MTVSRPGTATMIRLFISLGLHLLGSALGLIIAALVLEDMSIDGVSFVIAVLIFVGVRVVAEPLISSVAIKHMRSLLGSVALVSTFVGLLVTVLVSDGLDIDGAWTWVMATVVVWLVVLLAGIILPALFLKEAVQQRRSGADGGR